MAGLLLALCCLLTCLLTAALAVSPGHKVVFTFPEFPYKETSKNVSTRGPRQTRVGVS